MLTTVDKFKKSTQCEAFDDETLGFLIRASSAAILKHLNRRLKKQETVEALSGNNTSKYLNLDLYPVIEIHSVLIDDVPVTDFLSDPKQGRIYREKGWPNGVRNIAVVYTGGYILPGNEGANLPEDIELACILHVQDLMRQPGVTSERVGDLSVTYEASEMSSAVRSLLDGHRKFA